MHEVLFQGHLSKTSTFSQGLFYSVEGLERRDSMFLEVLKAALKVLDYSYRSASSAPITEEMKSIPHSILCDIFNFCETATKHYEHPILFSQAGASATQRLSALLLDAPDALIDTVHKYLYEEQERHLQELLQSIKTFQESQKKRQSQSSKPCSWVVPIGRIAVLKKPVVM